MSKLFALFSCLLLIVTAACAEQKPATKKKKNNSGDLTQNGGFDDPTNDGTNGGDSSNGGDDDPDNDDDGDDDDDDNNGSDGIIFSDSKNGLKWQALSGKLNWCAASGIEIKDPDNKQDLQNQLNNGGGNLDPSQLSGLVSGLKDSGFSECIKDEGSGQKEGKVESQTSLISGLLQGGNGAGADIGDDGEGCRDALGKGWRLPTLKEAQKVDAEALTKKIKAARSGRFWTSTTVKSEGGANGGGGLGGILDVLASSGQVPNLPEGGIPPELQNQLQNNEQLSGLSGSLDGPTGAWIYRFDDEDEEEAGKQEGVEVICVKED